MKKFTKFELIGIGISLLLICIIISLIGKYVFDLQGDYLSAAATLFAAVIAALLYSDWKVQHKIQLLDKYHNELKLLVLNLTETKKLLGDEYFKYIISNEKDMSLNSPLDNFENKLNRELKAIGSLLNEYLIFLKTLELLEIVKQHASLVINLNKEKDVALEDLKKINQNEALDQQTLNLIKSLHGGGLGAFIISLQVFAERELPSFYFEFFNAQN